MPPMPVLIAQGEARAVVRREPRTIQQILDDARKSMELEDSYCAWLAGEPVPQLRHPRRTLRQWLTGRRPEPAPAEPMTSVELIWRSNPPG
jgi:hypothetical protein